MTLELDWAVVAPFTVAAVARHAARQEGRRCLSGAVLTRAFAVMLVLVGGFVAVQSVGALIG